MTTRKDGALLEQLEVDADGDLKLLGRFTRRDVIVAIRRAELSRAKAMAEMRAILRERSSEQQP